ncbi:hypothetical protein KFE25_005134 [Diacronema lutheri]|uniref:Uncharacterized protein n=1 Tax=Diacronema lutheri TaxID=2081491 RepID=A0A8J6C0X7_DIALT|nr:hypothetical protein KFE25_005134 [Diacronema lutheri]
MALRFPADAPGGASSASDGTADELDRMSAWLTFDALRREQGELLSDGGLGSRSLAAQRRRLPPPSALPPKPVRATVLRAQSATRIARALTRVASESSSAVNTAVVAASTAQDTQAPWPRSAGRPPAGESDGHSIYCTSAAALAVKSLRPRSAHPALPSQASATGRVAGRDSPGAASSAASLSRAHTEAHFFATLRAPTATSMQHVHSATRSRASASAAVTRADAVLAWAAPPSPPAAADGAAARGEPAPTLERSAAARARSAWLNEVDGWSVGDDNLDWGDGGDGGYAASDWGDGGDGGYAASDWGDGGADGAIRARLPSSASVSVRPASAPNVSLARLRTCANVSAAFDAATRGANDVDGVGDGRAGGGAAVSRRTSAARASHVAAFAQLDDWNDILADSAVCRAKQQVERDGLEAGALARARAEWAARARDSCDVRAAARADDDEARARADGKPRARAERERTRPGGSALIARSLGHLGARARYSSNYHGALVTMLDTPGARGPFDTRCRQGLPC